MKNTRKPKCPGRRSLIPGSRGTLLKRQPEEASSIEPMHGGLAVEFVTQMRNALLTRDADQHSRFAVFARLLG